MDFIFIQTVFGSNFEVYVQMEGSREGGGKFNSVNKFGLRREFTYLCDTRELAYDPFTVIRHLNI